MIAILAINFLPMFVCASAWDEDFSGITLGPISSQSQVREGSKSVILYVSEDSTISANNGIVAQLSGVTDTLVTEYKLTFDDTGGTTGIGTGEDGGGEWQPYDVFLTTGAEGNVTYAIGDGEVVVTLYARARNKSDNVADSGAYIATQTLTVSW
jgi:hypothetical protein